jgi:hypothetical protein
MDVIAKPRVSVEANDALTAFLKASPEFLPLRKQLEDGMAARGPYQFDVELWNEYKTLSQS